MISNNTLITSPVSIYDIQKMFNVVLTKTQSGTTTTKVSCDLGTIIGKNLGQSIDGWSVSSRQNINKWAKYKPVKLANAYGLITDAQRLSVQYGLINIPSWSRLDRLATYWLEEDTSSSTNYPDCGLVIPADCWKYDVPTGGTSSPFRLTDFVAYSNHASTGYLHDAECQIGAFDANVDGTYSKQAYITPQGFLRLNWHNGAQSTMTLKFADFNYPNTSVSLDTFKFGCVMERTTDTTKYAIADDTTVGDTISMGVKLDIWFETLTKINSFMNNADTKQFYITPIFANGSFYDTFTVDSTTHHTFTSTNLSQLSANRFVTIFPRETITISKKYAELTLSNVIAYKDTSQSTRLIYYSMNVKNMESDVNRSYRITVELRKSDETVINTVLRTGTISGGATISLTGSIDAMNGGVNNYVNADHIVVTSDFDVTLNNILLKRTNTAVAPVSSNSTPVDPLDPYA